MCSESSILFYIYPKSTNALALISAGIFFTNFASKDFRDFRKRALELHELRKDYQEQVTEMHEQKRVLKRIQINETHEEKDRVFKRIKRDEGDTSLDRNYSASFSEANVSKIPATDTFVRINKNFLEMQQERHSQWLFGGLAELIHNSYDHGKATKVQIKVFYDNFQKENVLEICDNGDGMLEDVVSTQLFSFGKEYDRSQRTEDSGIGQYGIGFKQGSIRVASTVVVISKQADAGTVSVGIICNRPYEEHEQMFVFNHATVSVPGYRGKDAQEQIKYDKVADLVQKWSFLTRERLASEVETRWGDGQSGTAVFLQHWREGSDKLVIDEENNDLKLIDKLTDKSFRQSSRHGNVEEDNEVEMDCSLREYLSLMFYTPSMEISVLGKKIKCVKWESRMEDMKTQIIVKGKNNLRGITAMVGTVPSYARKKLGGVMIYSSGCLIRGFERQSIGINSCARGWGIIAVVHLPTDNKDQIWGLKPQQHKQDMKPTTEYQNILKSIKMIFEKYEQLGLNNRLIKTEEHRETLSSTRTEWIQCDQCNKWRVVSKEVVQNHMEGAFYCHSEDSPVMKSFLAKGTPMELARNLAHAEPEEREHDNDMVTRVTASDEVLSTDEKDVKQAIESLKAAASTFKDKKKRLPKMLKKLSDLSEMTKIERQGSKYIKEVSTLLEKLLKKNSLKEPAQFLYDWVLNNT